MRQLLLSSMTRRGFLHQGSKYWFGCSSFLEVVGIVVVVRDVVGAAVAAAAAVGVVDREMGGWCVCEIGFSVALLLPVVFGTSGVCDGAGRVRPRFRIASSRTTLFHLLTRAS